jgi:hypothetical protein
MKYYVIVTRVSDETERAVIVKAKDIGDARALAKHWRGLIMNIVEVVPPNAYLKALTRKDAA